MMKKIIIMAVLAAATLAYSCDSNNKDENILTLEYYEVDCLYTGEAVVGIALGSGDYTIIVDNKEIATAEVVNIEAGAFFRYIKVKGLKPGETYARVIDNGWEQEEKLTISVYERGLALQQVQVRAFTENVVDEATSEKLTEAVREISPFTPVDQYIMSDPSKGMLYTIIDIKYTAKQPYTQTENGSDVILVFNDLNGQARTLSLAKDQIFRGTRYYLDFFGYWPEARSTRDEIQPNLIGYNEDVTDRLSADFPGAGTITAQYIINLIHAHLNSGFDNESGKD